MITASRDDPAYQSQPGDAVGSARDFRSAGMSGVI
jgi:hypothetical protein